MSYTHTSIFYKDGKRVGPGSSGSSSSSRSSRPFNTPTKVNTVTVTKPTAAATTTRVTKPKTLVTFQPDEDELDYGEDEIMEDDEEMKEVEEEKPMEPEPERKWGKILVTVSTQDTGSTGGVANMDTAANSGPDDSFVFRKPTAPAPPRRQINFLSVPTTPVGPRGVFFEEEDDSDFIGNTEPKGALTYDGMALDDIIQVKKHISSESGSGINFPGSGGSSDGGGFPRARRTTPMTALRQLVEKGMSITVADKEISSMDGEGARQHRWRAEWTCGEIKGIGEGGRRLLAKQVGALDLVDKLKKAHPELALPDCIIPLGCMVNPFIFWKLASLVQDYAVPDYAVQVSEPRGYPYYTCICTINDTRFIGENSSHAYAKRFAAKRAYETISGRTFYLDPIIKGEKCSDESCYTPIESETNRIFNFRGTPSSSGAGCSEMEQNELKRKARTQDMESFIRPLKSVRLEPVTDVSPRFLSLLPQAGPSVVGFGGNSTSAAPVILNPTKVADPVVPKIKSDYREWSPEKLARVKKFLRVALKDYPPKDVHDPDLYDMLSDTDEEDF